MSGLNVGSLMSALSAKAGDLQARMDSPDFDASDQGQLLNMGLDISKYQQMASLASAIVSDVKQTAQGIIQKI
ncbi:EscF/YscF/HrpA family type III secretion system needle major subunit [uncultured Thiocystis sp.]|jgi:hypothetical protein|uniref:EscF/YscF/HrpA family type III secretion system needle major subunit n=1 Tax=uncultured Thiocystis sp. TaxID=1202134 RepID=UPI0025EBCCA9|nr:EscF/YscF/HrpA family type III secretion system needle major subunit [uncultured Thiocystis sp.]